MYGNVNEHYAAATQAEMRKSVVQMKDQKAPTRASLRVRKETGSLLGLEIPYYRGVHHGSVALDPISGKTSFGNMIPALTDKMYVGLAFMGFTVEWEHFHQVDAERGKFPETRFTQRNRVMASYLQEQNWYIIGLEYGTVATCLVGGGTGTITLTYDNVARERSKGSIRLAISYNTDPGKRVLYESWNKSTHTKTATFYVIARPTATTAQIVVIDGGTVGTDDVIVKEGFYRQVPYGLGYHSLNTARDYQGADTSVDAFLNAKYVNGGNALINPTTIDSAKLQLDISGNSNTARMKRHAHLTHGNYRILGAFGYNLRTYNAENGQADTTYGLPRKFEDEDTVWHEDENMEDAFIYMRDAKSLFEYRQTELQKISKGDGTQWIGLNTTGSTEFYDNYGESYNIAWDGRGDDGKGEMTGNSNSMITIGNLQMPPVTQVSMGEFQV